MTTTYLHFQLDERINILAKNFLQTHLLQRDLHRRHPRRDLSEEPETSPTRAGRGVNRGGRGDVVGRITRRASADVYDNTDELT